MKDFELWSKKKISINSFNKNRFYRIRDIWWCSLGINIGFEQDGKDKEFQRPVLILKSLSRSTCLVIPLTTSEKANTYRLYLGIVAGKESRAIISQIRVIDTKRLINKIDVLDNRRFESIRKAIKDML